MRACAAPLRAGEWEPKLLEDPTIRNATMPKPRPPRPRVYSIAASPAFRRQALHDRKDLKTVEWSPELTKFGADALNLRFRRRFNQPMDEAAWRGWIGVKLAAEEIQVPDTVK